MANNVYKYMMLCCAGGTATAVLAWNSDCDEDSDPQPQLPSYGDSSRRC